MAWKWRCGAMRGRSKWAPGASCGVRLRCASAAAPPDSPPSTCGHRPPGTRRTAAHSTAQRNTAHTRGGKGVRPACSHAHLRAGKSGRAGEQAVAAAVSVFPGILASHNCTLPHCPHTNTAAAAGRSGGRHRPVNRREDAATLANARARTAPRGSAGTWGCCAGHFAPNNPLNSAYTRDVPKRAKHMHPRARNPPKRGAERCQLTPLNSLLRAIRPLQGLHAGDVGVVACIKCLHGTCGRRRGEKGGVGRCAAKHSCLRRWQVTVCSWMGRIRSAMRRFWRQSHLYVVPTGALQRGAVVAVVHSGPGGEKGGRATSSSKRNLTRSSTSGGE